MEIEINRIWARKECKPRGTKTHKGSFGTATIVAGCRMYRGAAVLAAGGALRAGAGIVRVASIEAVCSAVAAQLPSCICYPLKETMDGCIQGAEALCVLHQKKNSLLVGCGLGNTEGTAQLTKTILANATEGLVLDADALNGLAGYGNQNSTTVRETGLEYLRQTKAEVILTPHLAEMARLCGVSLEQVQSQTAKTALEFAVSYNCVVVLKSEKTVVATPNGTLYVLQNADNPGLAKGGSGDVLAGIIVSLLAQGYTAEQAAPLGVWLHSRAGFIGVEKHGVVGVLPSDLPLFVAEAWKELNEKQYR